MPEFWTDAALAQKVLKEKGAVERTVKDFLTLSATRDDVGALWELAAEAQDQDTADEAAALQKQLEVQLRALETRRLLSGEHDQMNAVVEINPGAGGTDSCDWAQMLMRMISRWAERRGFTTELFDRQDGEEAGIKSVTFAVRGPFAYGYLQSENGVHRLVRISPFDKDARRQTAFAGVAVLPEVDDTIQIDINPADIEWESMRSGGAGGQHVNKTESAVRLRHIPSGVVIRCEVERSQHKNRDKAMQILRSRLYQLELDKRMEAQDAVNAKKRKIDFGSQIRSYVLQPYQQAKDLRTEETRTDVDNVLDGDITGFMEAWLAARAEGRLEG